MDTLRDNEEVVLDWYDCLLTKEAKSVHLDTYCWCVYEKGRLLLTTSIDTYALQYYLNLVQAVKSVGGE